MWSSAKSNTAGTLGLVFWGFFWLFFFFGRSKFLSKWEQFCRRFNPHFMFFQKLQPNFQVGNKTRDFMKSVLFHCMFCYESTRSSQISTKEMKLLTNCQCFVTFHWLHDPIPISYDPMLSHPAEYKFLSAIALLTTWSQKGTVNISGSFPPESFVFYWFSDLPSLHRAVTFINQLSWFATHCIKKCCLCFLEHSSTYQMLLYELLYIWAVPCTHNWGL